MNLYLIIALLAVWSAIFYVIVRHYRESINKRKLVIALLLMQREGVLQGKDRAWCVSLHEDWKRAHGIDDREVGIETSGVLSGATPGKRVEDFVDG